VPGLKCTAVQHPLENSSLKGWQQWFKVAQLIEELPP
jgi:hypothetical protein